MFGVPCCSKNTPLETVFSEFSGIDFPYITVGLWEGETKAYSFFTNESWQDAYINQHLFLDDPLLNLVLKIPHQHIWWKAVNTGTRRGLDVMKFRYNMCDLTTGVTYAFKKNQTTAVIAIGGKGHEDLFLKKYISSFEKIINLVESMVDKVNAEEF